VDATTLRLFLPADREYSFSGNMDSIEEMEVAISRAEAYASDITRARNVLQKGSRYQQSVAVENLERNTRELQASLDEAQGRMQDLAKAAAEGRVDQERLAAGQRKAKELAREIEEALGDVRRNAAVQTESRGHGEQVQDAEVAKQQQWQSEAAERDQFATKEGQSFKKWAANDANVAVQKAEPAQNKSQTRAQVLLGAEKMPQRQQAGGKGPPAKQDDANVAFVAHEDFDDQHKLRGETLRVRLAPGPQTPGAEQPGGPTTGGPEGGGPGALPSGATGGTAIGVGRGPRQGGGGGPDGAGRGADAQTMEPGLVDFDEVFFGSAPRPGPLLIAGSGGGGGVGSGGGGGGGDRTWGLGGRGDAGRVSALAAPVRGLVSLAPPLVEQGRAYSFRKLDAAAELTVSSRTPGLAGRLGAAAAFLALAALVWFVHRRRARRQGNR
jgi:hypothetical protein